MGEDDLGQRRTAPGNEAYRRALAEYEREKKAFEEREQKARDFLRNSEKFQRLLSADRELDDARLRELAIQAGARIIAGEARKREELAVVSERAKAWAFEQEILAREKSVREDRERDQARREALLREEERGRDYFAKNAAHLDREKAELQPLGKYRALDETTRQLREESDRGRAPEKDRPIIERETRNPAYRSASAEITADARSEEQKAQDEERGLRARADSDRRQTPAAGPLSREQREQLEQDYKTAGIEQTDRRQARDPEVAAAMKRRGELLERFRRSREESTAERDFDSGIER